METSIMEKVLKSQDKIIYFSYNSFDEAVYVDRIDSELDIPYTEFNEKFLEKNLEIIPKLKTSNLLYLINSNNEAIEKQAKQVILSRVTEKGEHFFCCENVKFDVFGMTVNLWDSAFSKMNEEERELIKNEIFNKLDTLKDEDQKAYEIISKAGYITSIDNFLAIHEFGIFTPDKLKLLEKLATENPNVLDSINYKIFEDSIFDMGEVFVSRIAKYPNISKKMIMIAENNPKLLEVIKKGFGELENDKRLPEILEIQRAVITYAAKNCDKIDEIRFEDLANCALREKEHESVSDYEKEFYRKCDEEYEKLSNSYVSLKLRGETLDKKKILLMKFFGIDRYQAEKFCSRYGKDIDSINVMDNKAKEYLQKIQQILQLKTEDEIDTLYYSMTDKITPLESIHFKDILRESYAQTYVKSLQETDDKLKQNSETKMIDVNGKKIKQIHLKGRFHLLVHSTDSGFKGEKELVGDSFVRTWDEIEDTERHLASSCYITQDFLGCIPANENGVVAVFTTPKSEDINLMGPTDIDSNIKSFSFTSNKGLYMSAENMPYHSRKVYNEVPIERKHPDYILIFDDTSEKVIQNSYKAAAEFDVPVIFIDKKEVVKNQLENLDNLSERFKETKDLAVLSKLVSTYETNIAGWLLNRDTSEDDDTLTKGVNHERFRKDFEQRQHNIFEMVKVHINELLQSGNSSEIVQIISIMQNEIEKYDLIDIQKAPISKTKMKFNAQAIIDEIKQKAPEIIEEFETKNNDVQRTCIDFEKLSKQIAKDKYIVKGEVDSMDKSLDIQKEASLYEE